MVHNETWAQLPARGRRARGRGGAASAAEMRAAQVVQVLLAAAGARALLPLQAERLRAAVGGHVVMNCHLDFPFGHEIPYHLQWDKDGEMVLSYLSGGEAARVGARWGGRARRVAGGALGGGSLNVSAVRDTDAGLFRCRVSFPNRSPPARNNGTFYYLDVDGGTVITRPPVNVTVVEGERAELECGAAPGARVTWQRAGDEPPAVEPPGDEPPASEPPGTEPPGAELPANGSLVLRAAAAADAGRYECRASLGDREQTAEAYLDVQFAARVEQSAGARRLPLGRAASLDCPFRANPPLTNLRWEKDGFLFDPYNVPGVFYSRNGSLLFNRVDESHEGEYSCTAYNALGTAGPSPRVRVRVLRPPTLATRPRPLYLARLGQPLALPCAAAAQPPDAPPPVVWTRKDGAPLPARYSAEAGRLAIAAVAAEDRGVLVCTARNAAAAVSAEAELLVENLPPRAPAGLAASAAAHALRLAWAPGRAGDDVEYTVWYRERAAHSWRTLRVLTRGAARATLRGLRAGTPYELRVLAQDALGDGLFSKPLLVSTLDSEAEGSEAALVAAATEAGAEAEEGEREEAEEGEEGGQLQVGVRLLDDGALVRWARPAGAGAGAGAGGEARCTLRWYRDEAGERRLLATAHTHHDHMLVSSVEEGGRYLARVWCADGALRGGARAAVPRYARLRAAAAGCAAAALLLAAAGAACAARRRVCRARRVRRPRLPPPAPAPPPPPPKRRY